MGEVSIVAARGASGEKGRLYVYRAKRGHVEKISTVAIRGVAIRDTSGWSFSGAKRDVNECGLAVVVERV